MRTLAEKSHIKGLWGSAGEESRCDEYAAVCSSSWLMWGLFTESIDDVGFVQRFVQQLKVLNGILIRM